MSFFAFHPCVFFAEVTVNTFANFYIELFAFLLLSLEKPLCILNTSPLSDM